VEPEVAAAFLAANPQWAVVDLTEVVAGDEAEAAVDLSLEVVENILK
jgi:hypothetical protein